MRPDNRAQFLPRQNAIHFTGKKNRSPGRFCETLERDLRKQQLFVANRK